MNLPSYKEITDKALAAFRRFPITLTWAIAGSFFFIGVVNVDADLLFDVYTNSLLTFILGVSWLIGARFIIEQYKRPESREWLLIIILLLLALFYFHFPEREIHNSDPKFYIRFFLYFLAGHLLVLFAPFWGQWDKNTYWNYLKSVCIAIGRSALFSGVLYLGLVLALLAVDSLFEADIDDKRYGQLFIFCLGVVNTWTYLSDFPKDIHGHTAVNYNKALQVFVKYILIPLVLLYLIILYAYSLKIVLEWNLPKGWVSYLVTALALLGFLVQAMIHPIQKTLKSWSINKFYPWFYILLLPLLVLLFVAIFKRIGDYGITENRYFVLVVALWILAMALYLLISNRKRLVLLPISLFVLTVIVSFGPWGAFNISKISQVNQFERVYEEVKKNSNVATGEQYEQLKSIVHYLADRESVDRLDEVTQLSVHNILKDTSEFAYKTYDYGSAQRLMDTLGITLDPETVTAESFGNHYNYYSEWDANHAYDISDFDYFASISINNYQETKNQVGDYRVRYYRKNYEIRFVDSTDQNVAMVIPLQDRLKSLSRHGSNLNLAKPEEFILESNNETLQVRLIFTDLGFYIHKDSLSLNQARGFLFLKKP